MHPLIVQASCYRIFNFEQLVFLVLGCELNNEYGLYLSRQEACCLIFLS